MAQRVVICTGAASGIGESAARAFARDGYAVVLADRSTDTGEKLADELRRQGAQATFVRLDIADEASVQACIDAAVQAYGHVDAAVNCAGIGGPSMPAHEIPAKAWQQVMDIDATGTFFFTRAIVAYWLTQKPRRVREADEQWKLAEVTQRGSLVNIASINATLSSKNMAAYVAAKHAVAGISKNFAYEYVDQVRSTVESFVLKLNWDQGIRVNTVSPGCTLTPIMSAPGFNFADVAPLYLQNQAIKRFAHPDEIAPALLFLCSDEASFVTGTDMKLDAGWSAH